MKIFDQMKTMKYEQIVFFQDEDNDLRAIVAIHNTNLGPALGGLRIKQYNSDAEALEDAMRLAEGMTYKNAAADLKLGGGKAVIILKPGMKKNHYLIKSFARFVESLNGRYITSKDVGVETEDLRIMKAHTRHVVGDIIPPSYYTAYGIFKGILASAYQMWNSHDLNGKKVAIQGLGAVGYELAKMLFTHGCHLIVSDPNQTVVDQAVKQFNATVVPLDQIHCQAVDIFAPCALGKSINHQNVNDIQAVLIAGSANNQLEDEDVAKILDQKNILYAPDYIINAGGVIAVAGEINNEDQTAILAKCDLIYDRLLNVYQLAKNQNISTNQAAKMYTQMHINKINNIMRRY